MKKLAFENEELIKKNNHLTKNLNQIKRDYKD